MTTRRQAIAAVFGTVATAGCTGLLPGGDSGDGEETTRTTARSPETFTVSGRLIGPDGDPVTTGEVLVTIVGGGGVAVPDGNGSFSTSVTGRPPGTVLYSQSGPDYPDDGLHDFATLAAASPDSSDLGTVSLPEVHPVTVVVEDEGGSPVADVRVQYRHTADGVTGGTQFTTNAEGRLAQASGGSLELAGDVSFAASKNGRSASRRLTVTGERTVRLTLS